MDEKLSNEIKRIFLKYVVLKIIAEKPIHGYDIMQEIENRTHGRWAPSCGSIYPMLESLESKGWIRSEEIERRKVYTITPEGRKFLVQFKQKGQQALSELIQFFNSIIEDVEVPDESPQP